MVEQRRNYICGVPISVWITLIAYTLSCVWWASGVTSNQNDLEIRHINEVMDRKAQDKATLDFIKARDEWLEKRLSGMEKSIEAIESRQEKIYDIIRGR